jgi:hypothetical protein
MGVQAFYRARRRRDELRRSNVPRRPLRRERRENLLRWTERSEQRSKTMAAPVVIDILGDVSFR